MFVGFAAGALSYAMRFAGEPELIWTGKQTTGQQFARQPGRSRETLQCTCHHIAPMRANQRLLGNGFKQRRNSTTFLLGMAQASSTPSALPDDGSRNGDPYRICRYSNTFRGRATSASAAEK